MKKRKEKVGGMALFNGLLLRNKKRESIGRVDKDGNITVEINEQEKNINEDRFTIYDVPIIRGIISMKNMITSSVPWVLSSAQTTLDDKNIEDADISKSELISAYIISIIIILFLLAAIPNFISNFLNVNIRNISQALMQCVAFIIYLLMLAKLNKFSSLFEYHGAEHKVANAYEKLGRKNITVENVKKQSRFHIRCGGNFVIYLFLLILLITFIIPSNNLIFKTILQVVLLPFLAGMSYELIMYTDYLPKFLKFLAYPAMSIQFITTKEPSNDKIQLAIYTLFGCVDGATNVPAEKILEGYVANNKKEIDEFNLNDNLSILSLVKSVSKEQIFANYKDIILDYNEQIKFKQMLDKLYIKKYPIQYILQEVNFYNEKYKVTEDVLIPRVDSEILVQKAIEYIDNEHLTNMLDLCTGSGCLGISIAKNSSIKKVMLLDISMDALRIANYNINKNNANEKCFILKSDLFSQLHDTNMKFDILVSNPPYIPTNDVKKLDAFVQKEPHIALDGGKDGMDYYTRILNEASLFLNDNAILIFEIGFDELEKIKKLVLKNPRYKLLEC